METTTIKINILNDCSEMPLDPSMFGDVIFAEHSNELHSASQIILSGKYNKTYCVLAYYIKLNETIILLDCDRLFICVYDEIVVVDLKNDCVERVINHNGDQIFGIYKFKSGYFFHCESFNMFLNSDLDCVWELGSADIFFNSKVENEIEIHDDYIAVYDWNGYRHFYNEIGMIKIEDNPEYDMSKN